MKEEVLSLLKPLQAVQLATCEADQPRLRPMTLIYYQNKFYFATGASDAKSAQVEMNPKAECCLLLPEGKYTGYLRMSGNLKLVGDVVLKKAVADVATYIYHYWSDAADPGYHLYEFAVDKLRYMKPGESLETDIDI